MPREIRWGIGDSRAGLSGRPAVVGRADYALLAAIAIVLCSGAYLIAEAL